MVVRASVLHTVTIELPRRARPASFYYATGGGGVLTQARVGDGHRAITFRACSARLAQSDADGDPVTFWSGFVVTSKPMCVRFRVWIDRGPARRAHILPLGRRC